VPHLRFREKKACARRGHEGGRKKKRPLLSLFEEIPEGGGKERERIPTSELLEEGGIGVIPSARPEDLLVPRSGKREEERSNRPRGISARTKRFS